jgi:hypothetical protein
MTKQEAIDLVKILDKLGFDELKMQGAITEPLEFQPEEFYQKAGHLCYYLQMALLRAGVSTK